MSRVVLTFLLTAVLMIAAGAAASYYSIPAQPVCSTCGVILPSTRHAPRSVNRITSFASFPLYRNEALQLCAVLVSRS
jgi:hypothetical protein